jgi:hypothetical protein
VAHSEGGQTKLANAVLVHNACHPKGEKATKEFAERFFASQQSARTQIQTAINSDTIGYMWRHGKSRLFLPHDTEIRMEYRGKDFCAKVNGDQIIYDGNPVTPSALAKQIAANTSRNAWRDLWVKFPGDDDWRLAQDLREGHEGVLEIQL